MIEVVTGSLEEQIIKLLQKRYPITMSDLEQELHLPRTVLLRVLKKLHARGIVRLEPLSDTIFVRLMRQDFSFVGIQRQRKPVKRSRSRRPQAPKEYDGIMYS